LGLSSLALVATVVFGVCDSQVIFGCIDDTFYIRIR
jgi:hypothetical protein